MFLHFLSLFFIYVILTRTFPYLAKFFISSIPCQDFYLFYTSLFPISSIPRQVFYLFCISLSFLGRLYLARHSISSIPRPISTTSRKFFYLFYISLSFLSLLCLASFPISSIPHQVFLFYTSLSTSFPSLFPHTLGLLTGTSRTTSINTHVFSSSRFHSFVTLGSSLLYHHISVYPKHLLYLPPAYCLYSCLLPDSIFYLPSTVFLFITFYSLPSFFSHTLSLSLIYRVFLTMFFSSSCPTSPST